jgi:hypothetical protein
MHELNEVPLEDFALQTMHEGIPEEQAGSPESSEIAVLHIFVAKVMIEDTEHLIP